MGRFDSSAKTKEIKAEWWDDGEAVTIKRFTWGEEQRLEAALLMGGAQIGLSNAAEAKIGATFDLAGQAMLKMELGIVSWTFKDAAGTAHQLNRDMISKLDTRDGNFIIAEIDKYNQNTQVSASMVKSATVRVEQNREHLARLKDDILADPVMLKLAEDTLQAAEERLADLEEARAAELELFPES